MLSPPIALTCKGVPLLRRHWLLYVFCARMRLYLVSIIVSCPQYLARSSSSDVDKENVKAQNHLHGSYSLLASHHLIITTDLFGAGFWNYLREDITVALIEKRGLMIDLSAYVHLAEKLEPDDFPARVTLLLGKIINRCLVKDAVALDIVEWETLKRELEEWMVSLPKAYEPILTAPELMGSSSFPCLWTIKDWHSTHHSASGETFTKDDLHIGSSLQYYHTAMSILWLSEPFTVPLNTLQHIEHIRTLDTRLQRHANQVCSLAISSNSAPIWVNSFGPIAFCECLYDLTFSILQSLFLLFVRTYWSTCS